MDIIYWPPICLVLWKHYFLQSSQQFCRVVVLAPVFHAEGEAWRSWVISAWGKCTKLVAKLGCRHRSTWFSSIIYCLSYSTFVFLFSRKPLRKPHPWSPRLEFDLGNTVLFTESIPSPKLSFPWSTLPIPSSFPRFIGYLMTKDFEPSTGRQWWTHWSPCPHRVWCFMG